MNLKDLLTKTAESKEARALPILSFPAVQKLGITVNEVVHSAELQAKAIETIANETDTLAAVSLMDLSVEAETFGAKIRYSDMEIPAVTGQLVSDIDEAEALEIPDVMSGRTGTFVEAVRIAKENIQDKPVIAGMIGPFSLTGRLMDVTEVMYACYDEPETVHVVLKKATAFLKAYAQAMKAAGADGILMAEPLAGILSSAMMEEFSMPYVKEIVDTVQDDTFGIMYHNCGNAVMNMLPQIFSQGAIAYHFGNAVKMSEVLKAAPENALCMGNVDPVSMFVQGTPDKMRDNVQTILSECGSYKNFIVSSGCDIPAHASWDNINAFFDAVHTYNN